MSENIRDRIIHTLLALLLSVGLLMPLLGILDPSLQTPDVILWAAVLIIGLEVLCIKPFVAVIGLLLISIIVSVRLVVTGNIDYFTDVFHAQMDTSRSDRFTETVVCVVAVIGEYLFPAADQGRRNGLRTDVHQSPLFQLVLLKRQFASVQCIQNVLSPRDQQPYDRNMFF